LWFKQNPPKLASKIVYSCLPNTILNETNQLMSLT